MQVAVLTPISKREEVKCVVIGSSQGKVKERDKVPLSVLPSYISAILSASTKSRSKSGHEDGGNSLSTGLSAGSIDSGATAGD